MLRVANRTRRATVMLMVITAAVGVFGGAAAAGADSAAATYDGFACYARGDATPPDVVLETTADHATVTTVKGNITVTCTFVFDLAILPGGRVFKTSGWPCVIAGAYDSVVVTTASKLVMDTTGAATLKCWAKDTVSG